MFVPIQTRRRNAPPQPQNRLDPFAFGHYQQQHQNPPKNLPVNTHQFLPKNILQSPKISNGIGGLAKTLDNVQQVLKMVETTTPFIQEYGPMIKNLPSMYRMMKAFKNIDNLVEEPENEKGKDIEEKISPVRDNTKRDNTKKDVQSTVAKKGISTPKLFI